jgi:hypothetical protein
VLTRTTLGWIAGVAISALVGTALGLLVDGVLVLGVLVSVTVVMVLLAAFDVLDGMTGEAGKASKG